MSDVTVVIVASFLLSFKAVLLEGSEVAILSVATVRQLGKNNVLFGVVCGGTASVLLFLAIRQVFLLLPTLLIDFATGGVILYFSYRFLRGFKRYYFGKRSFRDKMKKMEDEAVEKDMKRYEGERPVVIPFSPFNSLPVLSIALTEGFEASLVLAAAGTFNLEWTLVGALVSLALIITISAVSYEYLLRVPRWGLDLLAGSVLLAFGSFFILSGILGL
ncbi:MAG: hypothetical protein LYZ69_02940 [Nitrososphaerales archaeon]|nr:hypothetical protein [Nitrososphaerales archaeon]